MLPVSSGVTKTSLGPVAPVGPVSPVGPVAPVGPVSPVGPVAPVGPVSPVGPVAPVGPVGPVAPVGPETPMVPVGPVGPTAPRSLSETSVSLLLHASFRATTTPPLRRAHSTGAPSALFDVSMEIATASASPQTPITRRLTPRPAIPVPPSGPRVRLRRGGTRGRHNTSLSATSDQPAACQIHRTAPSSVRRDIAGVRPFRAASGPSHLASRR